MRYCETPDELKKNPDAGYWINKVCNGDSDAESLLWSWWNFFHMFDDLIDKDKEAPKEIIIKECMLFMAELSFNSFYQKNKTSLYPMLIQFFNRWLDGDDWEQSSDPWKRSVSDVLRCGDMEIYFHFAYLCGGWDHMRDCKGVRCYDLNKKNKE